MDQRSRFTDDHWTTRSAVRRRPTRGTDWCDRHDGRHDVLTVVASAHGG